MKSVADWLLDPAGLFGTVGFLIFVVRSWPKQLLPKPVLFPLPLALEPTPNAEMRADVSVRKKPFVSIIVPARNEASNISNCLDSLLKQNYEHFEIIVVNDQSTDTTAALVTNFKSAILIDGTTRPAGWGGKQWACAQGAKIANGELLLFTDADTTHAPDSLTYAVDCVELRNIDLFSCIPKLIHVRLWERLLGPMHLMIFGLLNPGVLKHRPGQRIFAIGQYLMFRRSCYDKIGGHEAVRTHVAEDLPLATLCANLNLNVMCESHRTLYQTRMYDTFSEFKNGWTRNIRAGMSLAPAWLGALDFIQILALISVWTSGDFWLSIGFVGYFWWRQLRIGNYTMWGVLLFPWSIFILLLLTSTALAQVLAGKPIVWKAREYF